MKRIDFKKRLERACSQALHVDLDHVVSGETLDRAQPHLQSVNENEDLGFYMVLHSLVKEPTK